MNPVFDTSSYGSDESFIGRMNKSSQSLGSRTHILKLRILSQNRQPNADYHSITMTVATDNDKSSDLSPPPQPLLSSNDNEHDDVVSQEQKVRLSQGQKREQDTHFT
jgi:hypothetical protein